MPVRLKIAFFIGPSAAIASSIEAMESNIPRTAILSLFFSLAMSRAICSLRLSSAALCWASRNSISRFSRSADNLGMDSVILSLTSSNPSMVERMSSSKCFAIPARSRAARPSDIFCKAICQSGIAADNSSSVKSSSRNLSNSSSKNTTVASRTSHSALSECLLAAMTLRSRNRSSFSFVALRRW